MTTFRAPVDIANRAIQMCGASRITTLTEDSKNAAEVSACYDELRVAELRRNVWRFAIRKTVLRAIGTNTMTFVPAAYDPIKTYIPGAVVSSANVLYIAQDSVPITRTPADYPDLWQQYFGALTVDPWDDDTVYHAGELVYDAATKVAYLSLAEDNEDTPTDAPAAWSATVTYSKGQTVTQTAVVYQSVTDLNLNSAPPSANWETIPATQPVVRRGDWLKLNATLRSITSVYPLGAGPVSQSATANVFRLPNGYLREAPQDPKAGAIGYLGASSGRQISDYELEGNYIITSQAYPIIWRFVADVADVTQMDPMFCAGFAARIALEVCETLTQSDGKLQSLGAKYSKFMSEARIVNGIETGPTEPPEDEWISVRR